MAFNNSSDDAKQILLALPDMFLKAFTARAEELSDHQSAQSEAILPNLLKRSNLVPKALDKETKTTTDSEGSNSDVVKSHTLQGVSTNASDDSTTDTTDSSDTVSVVSVRPGSRCPPACSISSLKARYLGGATDTHRWISSPAPPCKSAELTCLPTEQLEKLRGVSEDCRHEQWLEVGGRWEESLCAEKKEEDRSQRPANGSVSLTKTRGPLACFLPLKELEVLRESNADLRYTMDMESKWITTVCAEKKLEDALALQRPLERMSASDARATHTLNRMEALDDRNQRLPVESGWSHDYYYKSKILLQ